MAVALACIAPVASGQSGFDDEPPELIHDSEAQSPAGPAEGASAATGWDDAAEPLEVIEDPELAGASAAAAGPAPYAQSYELRGVYHARFARDLFEESARDEVWQWQQMAQLEVKLRHSEATQFALGVRAVHGLFARSGRTSGGGPVRTMLDVLPVAGYLDTSPTAGLHLRVGYQMHHLGRFDVLSAVNVLSVFDNRSGVATLPGASEVAQLGARLDWDITPSLSLKAVYLPFFMPHVVDPLEGDYAVVPPVQGTELELAAYWHSLPRATAPALADLERNGSGAQPRGGQQRVSRSTFEAFAPDADLLAPQGALRLEQRGSDGAVAFTVVSALERLPEGRWASPVAVDLAAADASLPPDLAALVPDQTLQLLLPESSEYGRFHVFALDAALTSLGAVQLGAELSYTASRALVASREFASGVDADGDGLADTRDVPESRNADYVQLGIRAETVASDLVLAAEAFAMMVLTDPGAGRNWLGLESERYLFGGVGYVSYEVGAFMLELGFAVLNGPSIFAQPRVLYRLSEGADLELGANLMHGPDFSWTRPAALSLGGYYSHIDHVFLGFRYAL